MTLSLADLPQHARAPVAEPRDGEAAPRRAALRLVPRPEGLLQIHTAPFRGSVAAVFSQALRSAGLGSRVLISQFLKGGVDQGLEGSLWLCGRLQWLRPATPHCLDRPASALAEIEPSATIGSDPLSAVRDVWAYSRDQLLNASVDLLVLDELGLAIELGFLPAGEVTDTLERRPQHLDVILTGPAMPASLVAMADQITQLRRAP
ncbi:MAG: cob(I)yrinic acid a,c-diamide adenosyltransferase [Cyanobium sp.]